MEESVTNRQIGFIIFITLITYSAVELPKIMAEKIGTGAWITILIATFLVMIPVTVITWLGYIHQGKTLFEYSSILVGKFLTYVFTIIYSIYFLGIFAIITRLACDLLKSDMLYETPIWALSFLMLLVTYYSVVRKLGTIGRVFEFYGIIITFLALGIHITMLFQGDYVNILPIYDPSKISDYLKGIQYTIIPFLGYEVMTIIPFNKRNGKKIFLYTLLTILSVGLFYILLIESTFKISSTDSLIYYRDSLIVAIREMDVPFLQILRRLDGLFLIGWNMAIFCTISIVGYASFKYVSKMVPKVNNNITAAFVFTAAFIISILLPVYEETTRFFNLFTMILGSFTAFIIPVILLIMTKVKKYDKKTN